MKQLYMIVLTGLAMLSACSKNDNPGQSSQIRIVSLTASANPVMAYDTSVITVVATGDNLQYGWVVNHGKIKGSGTTIKYSACQSCIGLNTITCKVFNETGEVSDTIMIRVTPWHRK